MAVCSLVLVAVLLASSTAGCTTTKGSSESGSPTPGAAGGTPTKTVVTLAPTPIATPVPFAEYEAEAAANASAWQDDAVLTYAFGSNRAAGGGNLSVDGTSREWLYSYTSPRAGKYVNLQYVDGKLIRRSEYDLWDNVTPSDSMRRQYEDLYRLPDIGISCEQAASLACARYRETRGEEPAGFTTYTLTNGRKTGGGERYARWTIRFNANVPGQVVVVEIDARTGEVRS